MKNIYKNKFFFAIGFFVISLVAALTLGKSNAFAATITWDGGGSDNNFSTAANWSGDTAPGNGDSIVLPIDVILSGCPGNQTLNNDLNATSVTLSGVSFTGSRPEGCFDAIILDGNALKSSGNISNSVSYAVNWIADITAAGSITITGIKSTGDLGVAAYNVTLNGSSFSGVSGSGDLTLDSDGGGMGGGGCSAQAQPNPFSGDGSGYTGNITVTGYAGITVTSRPNDVARYASSLTVDGANATISFATDNGSNLIFDKEITINGGNLVAVQLPDGNCVTSNNTTVTLSGAVTVSAATKIYLTKANLKFTGMLAGKNNLKLQSAQTGTVTYPDGSTEKSKLEIIEVSQKSQCSSAYSSPNSKLIVKVDCSESLGNGYTFEVAGILAGTGKIGDVLIIKDGVIAPGLSPGTLSVANLEFATGGTYEFEVGKNGADKVVVKGTVKLGNGTLNAIRYEKYFPKVGTTYVIIDNDGTDKITGTFKNLPEGASFTSDGVVYQISYKGGSGNDVTLKVKAIPGAPNTGFAMLKNNPLLTLALTTFAAGIILAIAKRRKSVTKA